ncbi:hypothetical protein ACWDYJ_34490 [Streptomyces sp. NPDC003042]
MAVFVGIPTLSITNNGSETVFDIVVSYTMRYTAADLAFPQGFAHSLAVFEEDDVDDDFLFNVGIQLFTPNSILETRQIKVPFPKLDAELDTELGGEEIYAVVHHRRNAAVASATARTTSFPLAV